MKIVYVYDKVTKEFLSEYAAQESPLELGNYITPDNSTEEVPLVAVQGEYNYFNGVTWELKVDTRGKWYTPTNSEVEVNDLLEVIDPTWTRAMNIIPKTPEELDEDIRKALQEVIDNKAKSLRFRSGDSLLLYAGKDGPYRAIADVFFTWESSVWYESDLYEASVVAGTSPRLTPAETVALIPPYPL